MKKIVSIVFAFVLLSVGGLILGPSFIDWNKYKPEIVSRLKGMTGHEYDVAGNIELAIFPVPRVKIEKLSVRMPASMGGETIVGLDKVAVDVEPMPLLQKQIVIKSVELVKPVFNLGVKADGTAIWMTPELQKKMDIGKAVPAEPKNQMGSAFGNAISLNEVKINDGTFSYSDARKGTKTALDKIDLDIQGDSLFGPYKISGQVGYRGQPVKLTAKSGKISDMSAAIPVQAEFHLVSGGTVVTYSGVAVTRPVLELQGETSFKSNNLSETLQAVTGTPNPALAKPISLTGILTFKGDNIDYKNVAMNYAGAEVAGSVSLKNLKKQSGNPLDIVLLLKADKPVDLDALLPAGKKGTGGFIPETLALPMDMRLKADVTAKSATFKDANFTDMALSLLLGEKDISGTFKSVTPGQGKIDATYKLLAASVSRTGGGGKIFSDLSLAVDGSAQAGVPQALVKPFVPADALKGAGNLLTTPASAVYKVNIKPASANITSATVNILDTNLEIGGSYQPKKNATRDLLTINISAPSLDGDTWLKRLQPAAQEATAPTPTNKKIDIAGMAKKLSLPVDLDASLSLGSLIWHGQSYDKVGFRGRLIGNKLTIDTAGLEATGGNSLTLAGTVGDVTVLKDVDLTIQGKTPDTEKTLQGFKVDTKNMPKGIGPSEVLAEFKGQADNLSFVANAKALKGTMEASGALDDLLAAPKVSNLTVRVKHPNYVELARIFNPNFKSNVAMNKNLDAYTSMTRQGTLYTLKDFQATIGPSTITGQVSFDTAGARPKLTAELSAGDLALSDIVGYEKKAQANTGSDNVRWSRNAINVDWMRKYDADAKLTAKSLTWVNWRMDNAVIEGKLDNGVLALSRLNGGLYGGTMNAQATVTAPADNRAPLAVKSSAKLSNVSLESFVSSFSGAQLVKARGTVNLDTSIETAGVSPAALVFGLKGKGTTTGKDLVFDGFDLARVSRTLAQPSSSLKENVISLLDTSMTGGQTAFEILDGAFTISEGVINFDKLLLAGTAANVSTLGTVNLPLWTIDLENTITLAEPADAPPLKTSFRGPLDNPGKTFGKSALDSYIGNQLQKTLGDAIQDKLQDKGILDKGAATPQNAGDVIQNLIQQKLAPKAATPTTIIPAAPAVTAPVAPVPAPPPASAPVVAPGAPAPVVVEPVPAAPVAAPAPAAAPEAVVTEPAPVAAPQPAASANDASSTSGESGEAVPAAPDAIGDLIQGLTDQ